jgi:hypothetical protein
MPPFFTEGRIMDAEQVNRIGNHMEDLAARAALLRRYL